MTLLIGEKVTAEKNRRFERPRRLDLWNAWGIWHGGGMIGSIIVAFVVAVILVRITALLKKA